MVDRHDTGAGVDVGEVTFRRTNAWPDHDACGGRGRVPAGGGFWSGDPHADLCTYCWEVERDDPHRAPTTEEHVRWARAGIGPGGEPCYVHAGDEPAATIARLSELVAAGDLPRIALEQGPHLGDWLESGGVLPDGAIVRRTGVAMLLGGLRLRELELQLSGQLHGPPIDPDLIARIEAATDERGVIHDPALAEQYFAAMQAQSEAAHALRGWPEPVIEDGRVFPSASEDEPPLG